MRDQEFRVIRRVQDEDWGLPSADSLVRSCENWLADPTCRQGLTNVVPVYKKSDAARLIALLGTAWYAQVD
jgi:hypothetical protein